MPCSFLPTFNLFRLHRLTPNPKPGGFTLQDSLLPFVHHEFHLGALNVLPKLPLVDFPFDLPLSVRDVSSRRRDIQIIGSRYDKSMVLLQHLLNCFQLHAGQGIHPDDHITMSLPLVFFTIFSTTLRDRWGCHCP